MRSAILVSLATLLAFACGEDGPAPEVAADVHALRALMTSDPALRPIEEVEGVADERPVVAGRMLSAGGLPAARRQVARVREATMTSPEGRSLARRMASAYEQRVRGLEQWHHYLEDAATSDVDLLESITTRREAEVALMELDQEMERFVPTQPRPAQPQPSEAEPEGESEPGESESPY